MRWLELLREHHRVVREQVSDCGGFEVKAQGDGFMLAFPSARKAVLRWNSSSGTSGRRRTANVSLIMLTA